MIDINIVINKKLMDINHIQDLFFIFSYMICSLAIIPLIFDEGILINIIFVLIYLISTIIILLNIKTLKNIILENKLLISFILLIILSITWSIDILYSSQKLVGFLGVTLLGFAMYIRLNIFSLIKIIFFSNFIITVLSLVFIIYFPSLGIHADFYNHGHFRGVFTNKNLLGINMVISIVISILYFQLKSNGKISKVLSFLNLLASFYLLIYSNSKTSLVIGIVIMFFLIATSIMKKIKDRNIFFFYSTTIILTLFIFCLFLITKFNVLTSLLDRSPSLTGRTAIWTHGINHFNLKPILGHGYYGFWKTEKYSLANHFNGHNGFLDILIYTGVIGLGIFSIILLWTIGKLYFQIFINKSIEITFLFVFIFLIILFNIVETNFILTNDIKWSIFIFIIISANKNTLKKNIEN